MNKSSLLTTVHQRLNDIQASMQACLYDVHAHEKLFKSEKEFECLDKKYREIKSDLRKLQFQLKTHHGSFIQAGRNK